MVDPNDVIKAREILEISEQASLSEIKARYKSLLKKWHPDKQMQNVEVCTEKTRKIVWAYNTIMEYCKNYKFSFSDEEIKKQLSSSSANWWMERFGRDPLWGRGKE